MRQHMATVQVEQARLHNRGAQVREFQPGERVIVLVPTTECKFLAKWQGSNEVVERTRPVNSKVRQPGRRHLTRVYHVNLLKRWNEPIPAPAAVLAAHRSTP